jgi:hypothetical protein
LLFVGRTAEFDPKPDLRGHAGFSAHTRDAGAFWRGARHGTELELASGRASREN